MFKRIDHVEIIPSDFDKAITFYSEVLGFSIEERRSVNNPPLKEIAYLKLGDTVIEMMSVADPAPVSKEAWQVGYKRIALEVDDMEKAVTYLKTRGVKITREPAKLATSLRAEAEDPDGLSIELRQWLKR